MLLYLACLRSLATLLATLSSSRHLAATCLGLLLLCQALVSGYLLHQEDLAPWVSWLRYTSPQYWASHPVLERELGPVGTLLCHWNPMITDTAVGRDILRKVASLLLWPVSVYPFLQVKCGLEDGKAALRYFNFQTPSVALPSMLTSVPSFSPHLLPITILPVILLLLTLFSILIFVVCRQHQGRKRSQRNAR